MQKNPDQRYQSAAEMLEDIEAFQRNPSISFQYKYFIDEKPTKYVNAISAVRNGRAPSYNDGYDYDDYEEEPPRRRQSSSGGNNKKTMMVVLGILAAFLIVALSIGIAAIFRSCSTQPDDTMTMPNLVGQLYTDVQNNEEYAFKFSVETREDSSQETGIILDQTPAAGMSVKKDGEVLLVVNSGAKTINVPDVTNYLQADAEQTLQNAGFETTVIEVPDDKIAAGYVTSTEPKGNATAPEGSTVKILVSTGPENEQIAVPNVIDKNIEAARTEIEAAGLQVGDVTLQDDSDKPENTVIETNPLPGVPVDPDTKVNIVVSSGKQSEKTLEANVHLPLNVSHDIELKAYLDGTVMEDGVRTVNPAYNNLCTIKVTGTSGQKTLVIELDGNKYAVFIMDFDTGKAQPWWRAIHRRSRIRLRFGYTRESDTEEDWGDIPTNLPDRRRPNELYERDVKRTNHQGNRRFLLCGNGQRIVYACKARGVFRKKRITPLVGDQVQIRLDADGTGYIEEILPRKNFLTRPPVANIDQLIIVTSVCDPAPESPVDRRGGRRRQRTKGSNRLSWFRRRICRAANGCREIYEKAGIPFFAVSSVTDEGVEAVKALLKGKITAFTGNSGVGKSSLLNRIDNRLALETGEISQKLGTRAAHHPPSRTFEAGRQQLCGRHARFFVHFLGTVRFGAQRKFAVLFPRIRTVSQCM